MAAKNTLPNFVDAVVVYLDLFEQHGWVSLLAPSQSSNLTSREGGSK